MKKKIVLFMGSFLVIFLVNFMIPYLMPGDPFMYSAGEAGVDNTTSYSEEQLEELRAYYGLDKPLVERLRSSVQGYLQGDFGQSIHYKSGVGEIIASRLPWTLYIMGVTLILSMLLGTTLALWGIRNRNIDGVLHPILSIIEEVPTFLIGILFLFLIAARSDVIPLSGAVTAFATYTTYGQWIQDILLHSLLPIGALVVTVTPGFYFTARASFLSVIREPYVLHAKAKGIGELQVRWRYIFANGVTPVIACFFLMVGASIGGTMLVENVFAYPGLGTILYEAVTYRDYPLIQGIFMVSTCMVLVSLFLADALNEWSRKRGNQDG